MEVESCGQSEEQEPSPGAEVSSAGWSEMVSLR